MSTTTVCRGLQTCLEPQLVEPLTLRLTLAPHKEACDVVHDSIKQDNVATSKKTGEFGGWSFIESLVKDDKGTPYVHPLDKSSSSVLSTRSLELCTESLGSETGSDIGDENDLYFSSSSDSESRKSPARGRSRFCQPTHKKAIRRSFPPPLTSISGSDYVQYTPHREGGRLVIKATKIATAKACFQVERSDGRLRLRFKNSYNSSSSSEEDTDNDEEQVEERNTCLDDKMDGNTSSEDEMAIVKYQRPCSWYKASGHENKNLLNWKPFMGVAI